MPSKGKEARAFYETEALRGGWPVRQLDRQIAAQCYERTALSRNEAALIKKAKRSIPEEELTTEEEIKDPMVLEFLGLKDEYSESALEDALIHPWNNSSWNSEMTSRLLLDRNVYGSGTNGIGWISYFFIAVCDAW